MAGKNGYGRRTEVLVFKVYIKKAQQSTDFCQAGRLGKKVTPKETVDCAFSVLVKSGRLRIVSYYFIFFAPIEETQYCRIVQC